ncbi:hypothetical protein BD289DRAFT_274259 [Coniella lustricola]|uniref:Zn(2)-C6 fungal-type domain-containing protein n=1 Tax=Coniella lustricola TaxID=2025994 RepID=A0A2T3A6X4_9PEZI|nr:hypothetical protein BD289DRAFT_274259 [Coniella lustricola]
MERSLPSPPMEGGLKSPSPKRKTSVAKSTKPSHRTSKRSNSSTGHLHLHTRMSPTDAHATLAVADGRNKRVWKACERCRMKKTKCDGEFPCKRCKDDGLVCTAGVRKKTEFKQLPRGYAEVLENTQFALIATIHKLYTMLRTDQKWDLGEPDLNDRGQPVIHNIAQMLGCIRPNSDIDLPVHSVFPEDEQGLAMLASQLEKQEQHDEAPTTQTHPVAPASEQSSSSETDHSDFEDYRRAAFGSGATANSTLSPASLTHDSFDAYSALSPESLYSATSPHMYAPPWVGPTAMDFGPNYLQPAGPYANLDMLSQGYMESDLGRIKPHVRSCPNPEVMIGSADPMMFSSFDPDALRL